MLRVYNTKAVELEYPRAQQTQWIPYTCSSFIAPGGHQEAPLQTSEPLKGKLRHIKNSKSLFEQKSIPTGQHQTRSDEERSTKRS